MTTLPKLVSGIRIPDTALAADAVELAQTAVRSEIFFHSFRSFVLGSLIGKVRGLTLDPELLFTATILHDVGLSERFATPDNRFEVDGANAARGLMERHDRTHAHADIVWDAIALHSSGAIAKWKCAEVSLANAGIIADVHGAHLAGIEPSALRELLAAAPRTHFADAFLDDLAHVARTKPEMTQNTFVADVGVRMVPGFHLENFVDEFRGPDPFEAFQD